MERKIIIRDLSICYKDRAIIKNLNVEIPLNQLVVIAGNNGSGKTSFIKAILGKVPFSGNILFVNGSIHNNEEKSSPVFSYLEQNTPYQIPFTVLELVVMGAYRKKNRFSSYTNEDYAQARAYLQFLEITNLKDKLFSELSGGEQILVWLAQTLLMDSEIMLLDEPTRHLDTYYTNMVLGLLFREVEVKKKSVIVITHDLNSLKNYKGRLINLSEKPVVVEELNEENITRNLGRMRRKA